MRCFIDSNIIISAGLFPESIPAKALLKALAPPNAAVVCDYVLDETPRVINKKFPHKIQDFELFLYRTLFTVQLITTPLEPIESEAKVRDVNDRPILRAALASNCDVLITGDKDLLESGVKPPSIITPSEFLNMD